MGDLAFRAVLLDCVLGGAAPVSPSWVVPAFAARVEQIRSHLRPIGSVEGLLESYGREAALTAGRRGPVDAHQSLLDLPLEVAYALRLLELQGLPERTSWIALVRRATQGRSGHPDAREAFEE
jgi:hypothetical protein